MAGLAGLVLCGGKSTRMGIDKALVRVEGKRLVERVADRLSLAASPVFLAPGAPGRLGHLGYPEVPDETAETGPLGGLVAGLSMSPHPLMAVVAVDMPFASPEILLLLASLHRGEEAVVPVTESGWEPLHAVYSLDALPSLRVALNQGRLGLREALSLLRVREVSEREWRRADPSGRFALNVNRFEDLALLI